MKMSSHGHRRSRMLLLTLSSTLLVAGAALATTFRQMTLVELVSESQAVIRARCLSSESRWERGEIWTFTNFEVAEALKGNLPRLVTVRTLGGKAGHLRSIVEGAPQFRAGEEVYLFLAPGGREPFQIFAWAQGTFRIRIEQHTGRESVTQDSAELAVFDPGTQKFRRDGIRNLPTALFRKKINAVIETQ
jgi:hypothetical protein